MQTSIEIDFQGFTPNDRQRAAVQEHVELFENRFGLITSGRIVVIGPGGHHRTGDPYEIHIQLGLPAAKKCTYPIRQALTNAIQISFLH